MSCWVVPTIAAEIWGVGVDHILQRVREGDLPYRVDEGFMFVDVDAPRPPVEHPPTFTTLSRAEVEALRGADNGIADHHDAAGRDEDAEETQSPDDDEASVTLGDWRSARQRVALTRIPPGRRAAPQAA